MRKLASSARALTQATSNTFSLTLGFTLENMMGMNSWVESKFHQIMLCGGRYFKLFILFSFFSQITSFLVFIFLFPPTLPRSTAIVSYYL